MEKIKVLISKGVVTTKLNVYVNHLALILISCTSKLVFIQSNAIEKIRANHPLFRF